MANMAQDNLVVDKLLKLKPNRAELFYPTLPTYEEPFEGETVDEERQREQRNKKREVDWENECTHRTQGTNDGSHPLRRSRPKGQKSHLATLRYRRLQNLPPKNSTHKNRSLYNQRVSTRTLPDIYPSKEHNLRQMQFFRALQRSNESLKTFYSRLRELGSHAKLENLEEDLVTDLFISNMHSSTIQMELLSEVRTPKKVFNYAINRESELLDHTHHRQSILRLPSN